MIIAEHISKSFEGRMVLDDISFVVHPGESTALIGLNGAGKTTLLRMAAGIVETDCGYLRVAGKEPARFRKRKENVIGFLDSRHAHIAEDKTVGDSYALCRKMYHVPKDYYAYALAYAGERLKMQEFATKNWRELSVGECARADFLYTLLMRPALWIMDEPTAGVDYAMRLQMYKIIRHFKNMKEECKVTILAATHSMQEMECLCERVLILHEGKIIFSGRLEQLQEKYKYLGTISFEAVDGMIHVQDMPVKSYSIDGNKVQIVYDKRYVSAGIILKQLLETIEVKQLSVSDMDMETMIKSVFQQ